MNYADHIASLEATRKEKSDRMKAVHQASVDENRSMNTAEDEEFETLKGEIKSLEKDIARTREMLEIEKADIATAKPVSGEGKEKQIAQPGAALRGDNLSLKTVEKLEPGIAFARYAMCLAGSMGGSREANHQKAFRLAEQHYPNTESIVKTLKAQAEGANLAAMMKLRATVPAGTTTQATWAAPLVYVNNWAGDFISYLRPRTLIGQANFRPIPFNVSVAGQTSGGTGYWVKQGKAKPVTKFDFNATTSSYCKVAGISVITEELLRFSDPSAEALVRDGLADAVIARIDNDLFDPDLAAVANTNPAGLLNGVSPVAGPPASGVDADEIRCAILRLWAPWDSTFMGARPAYYTTPSAARYLASLRNAFGQMEFPGFTPTGGNYEGVPVRTSQYLANNGGSGGVPFILVDESEIYLADDGSVTLDASREATIEMSDAPAGDSTVPTASSVSLVSMFQTDSIALRAERFIWWGPRRSGAIQWIDGFPVAC